MYSIIVFIINIFAVNVFCLHAIVTLNEAWYFVYCIIFKKPHINCKQNHDPRIYTSFLKCEILYDNNKYTLYTTYLRI